MTSGWTVFGAVAFNLCAFILVTSLPAFQDLHHHWIFPVLAVIFAAQWALAGGLPRPSLPERALHPGAARSALLFLLGFLLLMGIVRHQSILACFGRCSFKLGGAAALAAAVFGGQARLKDAGFWGPDRARAAALGCAFWAVFLFLFGLGLPRWGLDLVMLGGAACLLPWRRHPSVKVILYSAAPALLLRRHLGEAGIILAGLALACAGVYAAGPGEKQAAVRGGG